MLLFATYFSVTYPFEMPLSGLGQEGRLGEMPSRPVTLAGTGQIKAWSSGEQTEVRGVGPQGLGLPWTGTLWSSLGPLSWLKGAECTALLFPQMVACHRDPGGVSLGGITVPPLGVLGCNHHHYSTLPFRTIFKCFYIHPLSWNTYH